MIPTELLQSLIISAGTFLGIMVGYFFLDRKIDRKIMKYWRKVKNSPEGKDLFLLAKEARNFLKNDELKQILTEGRDVVSELRFILKKTKERLEEAEEEESEEEEPLELPRIAKSKGS